jgi:hypothetical protein
MDHRQGERVGGCGCRWSRNQTPGSIGRAQHQHRGASGRWRRRGGFPPLCGDLLAQSDYTLFNLTAVASVIMPRTFKDGVVKIIKHYNPRRVVTIHLLMTSTCYQQLSFNVLSQVRPGH